MKSRYLLIILILTWFCKDCVAQNQIIDSLRNVLKTEMEDSNKVKTINELAATFLTNSADSSILLALHASTLAQKIGWTKGEAISYSSAGNGFIEKGDMNRAIDNFRKALELESKPGEKDLQTEDLCNIGDAYYDMGNYNQALDYQLKALDIAEELGNKELLLRILGNIGNDYYAEANYPKAFDYYLKALKIAEEMGNKELQANNLCNIGNLCDDQGDFLKALDYYQKALKIAEELKNKRTQAFILGNIGLVYKELKDFPKSLDYDQKALKLGVEVGNKEVQAIVLGNVALVYKHQGDYPKAIGFEQKALEIAQEIGNKYSQATDIGNIGSLLTLTGRYKEAEKDLKTAIGMDSSMGVLNDLSIYEESISQLYETTGRYKLAMTWYKKSMILKDTLFNKDKNKALTRKEMTYEFDKKQAAEKAEQEIKDAKQRTITWSVAGGLILVLVFAGFIFRSLRITRKQKTEIEQQKQLVEEKNKIVEEKNKDILDSITYAKRLQDAILPPLNLIKQYLPESFVLYKPKDIVAGDFYWMWSETTSRHLLPGEVPEEIVLIAAADCTGHGVPGALVSVVCSTALNRTVKEFKITEPGKILDKVRELVLETFEKGEGNIQDGMDISLCCINTKTRLTQWSGAYNSLWYIHGGGIKEVPADKQPIGKVDKPLPFNTHNLNLQKGDTLYLFTDGYADQFGGPKGKKFKDKQLQERLLANANNTMEEQKTKLESVLNDWKGSLAQVDDILIIGIRV